MCGAFVRALALGLGLWILQGWPMTEQTDEPERPKDDSKGQPPRAARSAKVAPLFRAPPPAPKVVIPKPCSALLFRWKRKLAQHNPVEKDTMGAAPLITLPDDIYNAGVVNHSLLTEADLLVGYGVVSRDEPCAHDVAIGYRRMVNEYLIESVKTVAFFLEHNVKVSRPCRR